MSLDTTLEAVASEAGGVAPSASESIVDTSPATLVETPSAAAPEPAKPTIDDTLRAAYRKSKIQRDEGGRFAPSSAPSSAPDTVPAPAEAAPQAEPAPVEATPPEATTLDPASPPIDAPRDFTAEQKAEFAKLPREAQEIVANAERARLAEYTRRAQEHSESRKQFDDYRRAADPFFQALKPFEQYLGQVAQSIGTPIPNMLAGLVQTEARLRTGTPEQKWSTLAEIAAAYGVRLDGTAPAGHDNALMGTIAQLRQELGQVKGYLTQQQQAAYEQAQRAEQATAGELQRTIAEFAKDKPYFEEVRPYAAALLEKNLASDLAQAYEQAVRAHPAVFAKIQADQRAADDAKRQAEARAKAEQARRAAAPNVRSAPSHPTPKTMDDTMREAFRRAQSAA